jgi:hypothetical protein
MRKEKTAITFAGVARRADVSPRTFLYENPAARAVVGTNTTAAAADRRAAAAQQHEAIEASW